MTELLAFTFTLLIVFQLKQLGGDYVLQTGWMVHGKAQPGWGFIFPLSVHVGVHALTTLAIIYIVNPALWFLALFDFALHFIMDRIKASRNGLGRYNNIEKSSYWISYGIDQMVHHLTHYGIIYWLVQDRFF